MIQHEPTVAVGLLQKAKQASGTFKGAYRTPGGKTYAGTFAVERVGESLFVIDEHGSIIASGYHATFFAQAGSSFLLHDVVIGIGFHWERKEDQVFEGDLHLITHGDGITVVNRIGLEAYLASVISSEMSASSPLELLKAHAITSRSWMAAMLEMRDEGASAGSVHGTVTDEEIVRWYDREDHEAFDVCADDHCQRYQGVTKIVSKEVQTAIDGTRGTFLVDAGRICDARFFKACGGRTEHFQFAWEDKEVPYLSSISDGEEVPPITTESEARSFIDASPASWCHTTDPELLRTILPSFDQETTDFYRWTVTYTSDKLSSIIEERSGIDFGKIRTLEPLDRGPSGRIYRLRIDGTKRSMVVGKELEIRKWLSESHLYSSAFYVVHDAKNDTVTLRGAGWGHGVGLCQIGAAAMAAAGKKAEEIVLHYFRGAELEQLYAG
jgi:SpoIID/LytB domain protein